MHYNCYFCGKVCHPEKPDPRGLPTGRYVCTNHSVQVWHNQSRLPEEKKYGWSQVYFPIDIGNSTYGFAFYPRSNAMRLVRYDRNEKGEYIRGTWPEINIRYIPKNLTPENAREKLSFYLTFW